MILRRKWAFHVAEPDSSTVEWETFHQQVRRRVTPAAWQTWIEPLASSIDSGSLRLVAPTDFHYRWVGDRYLPALEEAAMDTLGLAVDLSVVPTPVDATTD
jgi:chromosomal replication initiation ATPase DnaA